MIRDSFVRLWTGFWDRAPRQLEFTREGKILIGIALAVGAGAINTGMTAFFLISIVCSSLGIFALRGLYYAIMKEGRVPLAFTGSAVGFVSVIGYMPDVFMGPLMGLLLDRSPGPSGHQYVFWVVAGFALMGLIFSWTFHRFTAQEYNDPGTESHTG